jgi:transposase
VELTLGIDVACRAAHQASLARPDGTFVWTGRRFFTRPAELETLWAACGLTDKDTVRIVMEPTRNAWAPLASWFRHRGARVSMVPTTQSADLRAYYSKHAKNDHLDSKMLARLPLLHPEGLREHTGGGPAEPLRRIVKIRSSIIKRRTAVFQRLGRVSRFSSPHAGVDDCTGQKDAAEVGQGVFVVPSRDAAPLLEPVEAALDGVAQPVEGGVECGRPTAC